MHFKYKISTSVSKEFRFSTIPFKVHCYLSFSGCGIKKTIQLFSYDAKDKSGNPKDFSTLPLIRKYATMTDEDMAKMVKEHIINELRLVEMDKRDTKEIKELISNLNRSGEITIEKEEVC